MVLVGTHRRGCSGTFSAEKTSEGHKAPEQARDCPSSSDKNLPPGYPSRGPNSCRRSSLRQTLPERAQEEDGVGQEAATEGKEEGQRDSNPEVLRQRQPKGGFWQMYVYTNMGNGVPYPTFVTTYSHQHPLFDHRLGPRDPGKGWRARQAATFVEAGTWRATPRQL